MDPDAVARWISAIPRLNRASDRVALCPPSRLRCSMAYDYDALLTSTTRDRGVMEEIAVRLRARAGLRVLVDTIVEPFSGTPRADALQRSATCVLGLGASDNPRRNNLTLLAT